MPYHLGKICDEHRRHATAKKCRFCDSEIKNNNRRPDDDECNERDCRDRFKDACKKIYLVDINVLEFKEKHNALLA